MRPLLYNLAKGATSICFLPCNLRMGDAPAGYVVVPPPPKRTRLRFKTNTQTFCVLALGPGEQEDAHKSVYVVTLVHPQVSHSADGIQLVAPETFDLLSSSPR